ncbi:MAG: hypothetical protein ACOC33_00740 [bacterium]
MSIFGNFFGDKNLDNIEKSVDNIFTSIGKQSTSSSPAFNKDTNPNLMEMFSDQDDINKILENVTIPPDRLLRYQTYEEMVRTAPFIKRILRVYQPYILQKNPVSGQSYIIRETSEIDDTVPENKELFKNASTEINEFITAFDFTKLLKTQIIPKTVLYGDCFVELVDKAEEREKVDLNKLTALTESNLDMLNKEVENVSRINDLKSGQFEQIITQLSENLVTVDSNSNSSNEKTVKAESYDDILYKIHKPHKIIILETEHGTRLGYLEVMRDELTRTHNIAQNLSSIIGRLTQNVALNKTLKTEDIVDRLIIGILKKSLIKNNNENQDVNKILQDINPDVLKFLKDIVVEKGLYRDKIDKLNRIKVRFIRTDRMQQYSLPLTTEYAPYGTSLLDPIILPCKLYILSQLGNIITKLSRAPAIRKWTIEQGASQMSGQLIQKLKRELNNSRITVEDLGSWKSIPKILSDYKDLYLLSKQGNKSLDVEISSLGDPSVKVQDLQDARSEIIALSGIPAPYLGFNEVIELREQLVHANVTFATEISDIQESINTSTNELIDKTKFIMGQNNSPTVHAKFNLTPPVVLILQLIEMTMGSVSNILSTFQNLQIPMDPYFILQQYVPYINWNKFKEAGKKYNLKSKTSSSMDNSEGQEGGFPGQRY